MLALLHLYRNLSQYINLNRQYEQHWPLHQNTQRLTHQAQLAAEQGLSRQIQRGERTIRQA